MLQNIRSKMTRPQLIALGYFLVISLGTILLMLPVATEPGGNYKLCDSAVYSHQFHLCNRACGGGYQCALEHIRAMCHSDDDTDRGLRVCNH